MKCHLGKLFLYVADAITRYFLKKTFPEEFFKIHKTLHAPDLYCDKIADWRFLSSNYRRIRDAVHTAGN